MGVQLKFRFTMSVPSNTEPTVLHENEKPVTEWNEHQDQERLSSDGIENYQPGSAAEKKLLRKLDFRIIVHDPP